MFKLTLGVKQPKFAVLLLCHWQKCKIDYVENEVLLLNDKAVNPLEVLQQMRIAQTALIDTLIDEWLDFSKTLGDFKASVKGFVMLDNHLALRSYLVDYRLTLADIAVWGALKENPIFNKQLKTGLSQNHLNRWFLHIANLDFVKDAFLELDQMVDKLKDRKDQGSMDIPLPEAKMGAVVTRFPPEPSGYLHIGHAKAAMLNMHFAREYKGKLIVRFDDTNPTNEKMEFEQTIKEDLSLLGIKPDHMSHTSDHFDKIYELAISLIKMGKAYVDDTDQETMRNERFDGIESKNRNMSVQDTLKRFEEMKKGTERGLASCLRAKIDMQDKNKAMRDPVIYRCNLNPHHFTGNKWKVYPTYDFACPIVDSVEGVTHALRTIEYRDRNPQYEWFLKQLKLRWVYIWDFSRLSFVYTLLSKRKLTQFVERGLVSGWDDPRFPTVRGIRRRGMTIEALRQYILSQGASQREILLEWDKIWALNKKIIDPVSPRHTALESQNLVKVTVNCKSEQKMLPKYKKNLDLGEKTVFYGPKIYLEQTDALQCEQDEEVTLMDWGNAFIRKIIKKGDLIAEIQVELHLEGDFKKTKKKLTWLSQNNNANAILYDYDYLITKKKLEDGDDFQDFITPVTEFKTNAVVDVNLKEAKKGDIIQLERKGYYIVDQPYEQTSQIIHLILIPDGRMASLASKATANGEIKAETPKLVEVKKAKSAPVTPKSKMYTMEPLYKNEALNPSAGNMYRVSSIYDGMMYNENNSQPAEPKVEKPNKNAKANKATSKNQEASVNSAESSIISKLDIVVGKVLSVKKHPDAESLYIEQIDIGESEPRTVVSGLVNFMQPDEIDGKLILVLKNLKPVSMRGVKSHAMVLCASNSEHDKVEFLIPPAGSKPGDKVFFKGHLGEPEAQLNPKKKIFEACQVDFTTDKDLVAKWNGIPFETKRGIVKTGSIAKATIK